MDSTKRDVEKQKKRQTSVKPDGKDAGSSSQGENERFDSLQKDLLTRARKRADAASSNPPGATAGEAYVPGSSTRIGQPAFQQMDSDDKDGDKRRADERTDTVSSFPAPSVPLSDQQKAETASTTDEKRRTPEVVMRAEVVVVDIDKQAEKEEISAPERRDSRRVLLRDSSASIPAVADDTDSDRDVEDSSDEGDIRSEATRYDEFTADGPLMTSISDSQSQQPSPFSDIPEDVSTTSATAGVAETPRLDEEMESVLHEPSRSRSSNKGTIFAVALSVIGLLGLAGFLVVQKSEETRSTEQPEQDLGTQAPNTTSAPEVPMTQVTSIPEGAEIVFEGAVIGNTPTKVRRPTYEQIYLIRRPGYESQLLRISPTSGETVNLTLQPTDTPEVKKP